MQERLTTPIRSNLMKSILIAASIALGPLAGISLTSCASLGASSTEPLLSAAGFRIHTPKDSEQRTIYEELPAYKVQRGTHKGKIFYAYKDEKQGVVYVGDEAAYQKYQSLAIQRSIASDQRQASMMNDMTASRVYGCYGYPHWY